MPSLLTTIGTVIQLNIHLKNISLLKNKEQAEQRPYFRQLTKNMFKKRLIPDE